VPDDLSLEDVARALPGTGEIMASVGHCFGSCWHAARAGNYDLAAYFARRTRSLLRKLVIVRPKYAQQSAEFDREFMEPLYQALMDRDLAAFEQAYQRAVEKANFYHVDTGHPYIRWRAPEQPPDTGLDYDPG
jgi:hypothetical protein